MSFENKVVIVTGGGHGIGRGICCHFAKEKAKVVIAELKEETGKETERFIIENLKGQAKFIQTDVSSEPNVRDLVAKTVETFGGVDVLVNNAALTHTLYRDIFHESAVALFDQAFGVNLRGAFLCAKYCAERMREKKKGVIINIASSRAFQSEPNTEAYSASKGGIISLTHSLSISLGNEGIRVNSISPGWIDVTDGSELRAQDHAQHPVGRVGRVEDISSAVLFLASDQSSFITGENLAVDGGMTKKMIYVE